jgi:glycosyltransferase involved in cell wall biosynthesis
MMKILVNCGPAEQYITRCLESILAQRFADWEAYVTIDPCSDSTGDLARLAARAEPRIHVHQNEERLFTMANVLHGVERSGAQPEDVIVILDGDDWFATPEALRTIHAAYLQTDCWMTYGSWMPDRPVMPGCWPAYPDGLIDFRNHTWLGTAVRTWKRWLWDLIDDRDFRDEDGRYFRVTEDQATMFPMLEMSGTAKARHIPEVLMIYNRSSPHACAATRREEMLANSEYLKKRPPYARLAAKPVLFPAGTR